MAVTGGLSVPGGDLDPALFALLQGRAVFGGSFAVGWCPRFRASGPSARFGVGGGQGAGGVGVERFGIGAWGGSVGHGHHYSPSKALAAKNAPGSATLRITELDTSPSFQVSP